MCAGVVTQGMYFDLQRVRECSGIDNERPSVDPFQSAGGLHVSVRLHEVQTSLKLFYDVSSWIDVVKCIGQLTQICSGHLIEGVTKQSSFSERAGVYRLIILPVIFSCDKHVLDRPCCKAESTFSIQFLSYFCVLWSLS
jgi:hypothetical protein